MNIGRTIISVILLAVLVSFFFLFRKQEHIRISSTYESSATSSRDISETRETSNPSFRENSKVTEKPTISETERVANSKDAAVSEEESNVKLKPIPKEKIIELVQEKYGQILIKNGFSQYESDVIIKFQLDEIRSSIKEEFSAIDKAAKELALSKEKKSLLDQSFDELFLGGIVEFTIADVQQCMKKRLSGISDCTKSVLDDFLRDLSGLLETDVFRLSVDVIDLAQSASRKAIESCKETPERAEYQFRLVFVECETR